MEAAEEDVYPANELATEGSGKIFTDNRGLHSC